MYWYASNWRYVFGSPRRRRSCSAPFAAPTRTVCRRKNRDDIDIALIEGVTLRALALRAGVGKDTLRRHKARHLPQARALSTHAWKIARSNNLVDRMNALYEHAERIEQTCENSRHYRTALMGIRELARLIGMQTYIQVKVEPNPKQDILQSAEWITVRTAMIRARDSFPEAK